MHLKLLACEVFVREASLYIATTPNIVYPEFLPKGAHDEPAELRRLLQTKIEEAEKQASYDAILLCYGLCGNTLEGLKAGRLPLIIPRAHDCCTLFLGSKEKFLQFFGDRLSAKWTSVGYLERNSSSLDGEGPRVHTMLGLDKSYQELVRKYGEENAKYIWETLHPGAEDNELIYIETPETANLGYETKLRETAHCEGKQFTKIEGDASLIRDLINGRWDSKRYLTVQPGEVVRSAYDYDRVICSEGTAG